MDVHLARRILGVDDAADAATIREAHRRAIRHSHPDAGGSEAKARRVNAAWDFLRSYAPDAPPPPAPTTRVAPTDVDAYYVVDSKPADLLARLAEAGHEVGEVVFVDPHGGLLEIVVGDAPAVGQLAVAVGPATGEGTEVSFTLEPLGVTPAPPIGPVVEALMAAVRR